MFKILFKILCEREYFFKLLRWSKSRLWYQKILLLMYIQTNILLREIWKLYSLVSRKSNNYMNKWLNINFEYDKRHFSYIWWTSITLNYDFMQIINKFLIFISYGQKNSEIRLSIFLFERFGEIEKITLATEWNSRKIFSNNLFIVSYAHAISLTICIFFNIKSVFID